MTDISVNIKQLIYPLWKNVTIASLLVHIHHSFMHCDWSVFNHMTFVYLLMYYKKGEFSNRCECFFLCDRFFICFFFCLIDTAVWIFSIISQTDVVNITYIIKPTELKKKEKKRLVWHCFIIYHILKMNECLFCFVTKYLWDQRWV